MAYSTGNRDHHGLCATFEVSSSGEQGMQRLVSEHAGWELSFLPEGQSTECDMELRGKNWQFHPASALLYNGLETHTEVYSATPEGHRIDAVVLYPDYLDSIIAPLGIDASELVFDPVRIELRPKVKNILRTMLRLRTQPESSAFSFDCLATDLIAELVTTQPHSFSNRVRDRASTGHFPGHLGRAKRLMAERAFDPSLTVSDVAAASGLSKFHFIRTFREATGATPRHYLNALRVDQARQRIRAGETVTEAALASGFSSLSTFSKAYKRHAGAAPSAAVCS